MYLVTDSENSGSSITAPRRPDAAANTSPACMRRWEPPEVPPPPATAALSELPLLLLCLPPGYSTDNPPTVPGPPPGESLERERVYSCPAKETAPVPPTMVEAPPSPNVRPRGPPPQPPETVAVPAPPKDPNPKGSSPPLKGSSPAACLKLSPLLSQQDDPGGTAAASPSTTPSSFLLPTLPRRTPNGTMEKDRRENCEALRP
jgi:hypothetical protein